MVRINLGDGWTLVTTRESNFYYPLTADDERQLVHEFEDDNFWYTEVLFQNNTLFQQRVAKRKEFVAPNNELPF